VWVFQAGDVLQTRCTAALVALGLSTVMFSRDMREWWCRQRLGLAVRVANFGQVLMAALAPPLWACVN
jgi:hypothetical protein